MNITRLNFAQTLPFVKSTINKSHFISFDLEMSGIQTQELTTPSIVDSIQKRYEKQKQSINKFIPLQFGLSAFQVQPKLNKIVAYPFNFYIFPLTQTYQPMKFSFHAGTMNFLTKNQFNFNKLFYEGIPYTTKQKLELFKAQNNLDQFRYQLMRLRHIQSPEVKAFIKMHFPIIEEWINSQQKSIEINISFIKYKAYMLLKQKIERQYQNQSFTFSFDHQIIVKRTKMIITKSKQAALNVQGNKDEISPQSSILFNEVFDEIITSKKPLIIHNGFLDLMHVYYRFHEQLPNHWTQYKSNVHKMFPILYDNKYLFANSPTLNHTTQAKFTGLQQCFVAMRQLAKKEEESLQDKDKVKIQICEDFKEYRLDSLQCHEAGFDSLMTGYSFLKGVNHLNKDINLLINPQAFNQQFALIKNRTPQGSIKIPFNFEQNNQDIYTKDGNSPIFFKSVLNQTVEQNKLLQYFSKNYGSVSLFWIRKDLKQFCIIFLNEQSKLKFQTHLLNHCTIGQSSILSIQNTQFLVLSAQRHNESMNNAIKSQQQENQQ